MHISAVIWTVLNSTRLVCSEKERIVRRGRKGANWRKRTVMNFTKERCRPDVSVAH